MGRNQVGRVVQPQFVTAPEGQKVPEARVVLDALFSDRESGPHIQGSTSGAAVERVKGDLFLNAYGWRRLQVPADLRITPFVICRGRIHLKLTFTRGDGGSQKGKLTNGAFLGGGQRHGSVTRRSRVHFVAG
jgi:hypothetical protein